MVFMDVFKNKILIINTNEGYFRYINKCIGLRYTYYGDRVYTYLTYDQNGYEYICSPFNDTYYNIVKSKYCIKKRRLNIINIKYIIMYYSYFIYIKYYKYINMNKYYNLTQITYKKKFNCCDYYKIYSYI